MCFKPCIASPSASRLLPAIPCQISSTPGVPGWIPSTPCTWTVVLSVSWSDPRSVLRPGLRWRCTADPRAWQSDQLPVVGCPCLLVKSPTVCSVIRLAGRYPNKFLVLHLISVSRHRYGNLKRHQNMADHKWKQRLTDVVKDDIAETQSIKATVLSATKPKKGLCQWMDVDHYTTQTT